MPIGIPAPFNRRAIANAIAAWLTRACGITVIQANQNGAQPDLPYATYQLPQASSLGQDETVINGLPSNPLPGAEVAIEVRGLRKLVVSVNTYAIAVGDPEIDDARQHMDKARAALTLPSFREEFEAAGIAVINDEPIQDLDFVNADAFESRAQMDVVFCVASNSEERVGYIATAEVIATDLGWNPQIFTVPTE